MPRLPMIIAGSIPVIVALLIAVPLLTTNSVPPSTLLPTDTLEFEYTQRTIRASDVIVEREQTLESQVLEIDDSGEARLFVTQDRDVSESESKIEAESLHRLRALIKETGFMEITPSSFLPDERPGEYDLYTLGVTLNGVHKSVRWISNSTQTHFVPPLIVTVQDELDAIRATLG